METRTVVLEIPMLLYERLRIRATLAGRTVEAELLEILALAFPEEVDPPTESNAQPAR